jgi:hypothetical protein
VSNEQDQDREKHTDPTQKYKLAIGSIEQDA